MGGPLGVVPEVVNRNLSPRLVLYLVALSPCVPPLPVPSSFWVVLLVIILLGCLWKALTWLPLSPWEKKQVEGVSLGSEPLPCGCGKVTLFSLLLFLEFLLQVVLGLLCWTAGLPQRHFCSVSE